MAANDAERADGAVEFEAQAPVEPLGRLVALAGTVVDECRLRVEPDGLRIRATDPATVAAVDLTLSAAAFDRYEASTGRVGLDLERLAAVLSMGDGDGDGLALSLDSERGRLDVRLGELKYALGLIDPESIRSPPDAIAPKLDGLAELTTPAATLSQGVTAAEMVADHLTLAVEDEAFRVAAEGDTDEFTLTRAGEDLTAFEPAPAESLFSVDYLAAIERELDGDTPLRLRVGEETPLIADFEFADGDGDARVMVAPRIST